MSVMSRAIVLAAQIMAARKIRLCFSVKQLREKTPCLASVILAQAGIQCGLGTGHRPSPVRRVSSSGVVETTMKVSFIAMFLRT
jgi:hypothetical protein